MTFGLGIFNAVAADGAGTREFPELAQCRFYAWSTDGTFVASCQAAVLGEEDEYFEADPVTGEQTRIDAPPERNAIDAHREWLIVEGASSTSTPPVIYEDGVQVAWSSEQMIAAAEQVKAQVQVAAEATDRQLIAVADNVPRPVVIPACRRDGVAAA